MDDILKRIDEFLQKANLLSEPRFVDKEKVLEVIEVLKEEVPDDIVFLEIFKEDVENSWSLRNMNLVEKFYKILKYYGIIESDGTRKTVLETKGKTVIRKFIDLSKHRKIQDIMKEEV